MATIPESENAPLDIREQIARIDKLIVEAGKTRQDTRFAPLTLVFTGMGAAAAFFAAGVAFTKLLIH
ncbi:MULTISPECIES: hypothetical protein [unclassified Sphingomonas]|uniref:hypothetical protein n=1 Tax=unclassified Sphingomonas TaxID=196159 RepID=UPI001F57D890|nr:MULTISPECIES: hypothetical protein [unclassified Sphingomonas]